MAPARLISNEAILDDDALDAAVLRVLTKWKATPEPGTSTGPRLRDPIATAGAVYRARRKVDSVFGITGFSVTPAWDIMLDLLIARSEQKEISTSSACIGAACPPTTALRWLRVLEEQGLISKSDDANDGRRSFCSLTEKGVSLTEEALRAAFPSGIGNG